MSDPSQPPAAQSPAREAERQLLQALVDAHPAGLAVVSGPARTFRFANPAYRAMTPRPEVDPVGRAYAEVWPSPESHTPWPAVDRALAAGEPLDLPAYPQPCPDGSVRYYAVHLRPLRWEGNPALLIALYDTTALEAARRSAARHAAELDAAIGGIGDGLSMHAPDGHVVRVNQAGERIVGLTLAQMREMPLDELAQALRFETPEGRPLAPEDWPVAQALAGKVVAGFRVAIVRPDGQRRQLLVSAGPIHDEQGCLIGAASTYVDITPLVEFEQQREDLLRAVSHDLRNPLTVVQGHAQRLVRGLQRGLPAERLQTSAAAIDTAARRMNAMIQDLVDSTRLESGQLPMSLAPLDLLACLPALLQQETGALDTARVRLRLPAGLPPVLADGDHLERIVLNLLSNALKYSPPTSEVTLSATEQGSEVIISVADHGPGIAREQLAHLFERYYRAGTGADGIGLGLYITRQLVHAHGGRIWVESEVGIGSAFSFSLRVAS